MADNTHTTPHSTPALRAEAVCKYYRRGESVVRAVDQVTLTIAASEFAALLGASGSGKSTLLNLLAGLDHPSEGKIYVGERELGSMNAAELARYRRQTVGMVFQSFNLLPRMTLEENVELPLRLAEVERAERAARVETALSRVGLQARRTHRPAELSGGEQQRAAIARALVNQPSLLLADEPTGNLDSISGRQIMDLFRQINRELGVSILMVTHERPLAEAYASHLLTLQDGRLLSTTDGRQGGAA